jgi:hypothetical protein
MKQQFKTPLTALAYNNQYQQGQSSSYQPRPAQSIQALNPFGACTCYQRELLRHNSGFLCDAESVDTLPLSCEENEFCMRTHQCWPEHSFLSEAGIRIHPRIPEVRARWRYFNSHDSSIKKVSLLAYGQENDQKENKEEELEKINELKKRENTHDVERRDTIRQNWRKRTSAFFAVLSM